MSLPSWLATQPPTAIMRSGLARLRCLTRPRSANTFSCAFSRTEQVLNTMRSAPSALAAGASPSASASTAEIFSESYSFIWQPKVRMKSLPVMATAVRPRRLLFRVRPRRFLRRQDPDARQLSLAIDQEPDDHAGRHRGRNHDHVPAVADLRAR